MTLSELQAQREKLLNELAKPIRINADGIDITRRSVSEIMQAINQIEGEIASAVASSAGTSNAGRCNYASVSK